MKKLLVLSVLFFSMSAAYAGTMDHGTDPVNSAIESLMAIPPNNNGMIGKAKAAIRKECGGPQNGWQWQASSTTISSCYAGGFITRVYVSAVPNCPPNQPCIQVIQLAGYVDFGCDGEIISVNCGAAGI